MPLGIVSDAEFEEALTRCERKTPSTSRRTGWNRPAGGADPVAGGDGAESRLETERTETRSPAVPRAGRRDGRGRTLGATAIPPILKDLMAEAAIASGQSQKQVAEEFGTCVASVNAFANGHRTNTWTEPVDPRLAKKVDEVRNTIIGKARGTLLDALDEVTKEKLRHARVRDVSAVAKDMSTIIANQEPKLIGDVKQEIGAQFVFHVPETRPESEFDVIDVVSS